MAFLDSIFKRNINIESSFSKYMDISTGGIELRSRGYLKSLALEVCIGFLSRSAAQLDIKFLKDGKSQVDDLHYLFNVRPNTDQSASEFWEHFWRTYFYDGQVLVIKTDSNDFLIADSFTRKEYAVFPDLFSNVTVKGLEFERTYGMGEVIYLNYANTELKSFMNGMFDDYTELFSRMIQTAMFSNQVRATASIDTTVKLDNDSRTTLQEFIDKMFDAFRTKAFAIIPTSKGFNYNEISDGSNQGRSIEDITKVSDKAVDQVAQLLGIPVALIRGDLSQYDTAVQAFDKFSYSPMLKKLQDELNAKLLTKSQYLSGNRVEVNGIVIEDPLEKLLKVDKGISSGAISLNEARVEYLGLERVEDDLMDQYIITKNYQTLEEASRGGEN